MYTQQVIQDINKNYNFEYEDSILALLNYRDSYPLPRTLSLQFK